MQRWQQEMPGLPHTSNKPAHHTKDCPILKQIGLKLVKRTPANGSDAASRVDESPAPAPAPAPPAPSPSADGGSAATPGAFRAATEAASYDSGEEFDFEGKYEGSVYSSKPRSNVSDYPQASHATASCRPRRQAAAATTPPPSCHIQGPSCRRHRRCAVTPPPLLPPLPPPSRCRCSQAS